MAKNRRFPSDHVVVFKNFISSIENCTDNLLKILVCQGNTYRPLATTIHWSFRVASSWSWPFIPTYACWNHFKYPTQNDFRQTYNPEFAIELRTEIPRWNNNFFRLLTESELSRPRNVIHERFIAFLARVSRFALFASNIICLFCRLQKDFRRIVRFSLATVHSRVTVPCLCRVSRKRFSGHCAGIIGCGIEREWSLRAFANMWAVRVFANTTWPGIKFVLRAASTLKIPDGEQRALLVGISLLLKSYLKETSL